jgi:hypothetical protein
LAPLVDGPLASFELPEELPLVDCSLASPLRPEELPLDCSLAWLELPEAFPLIDSSLASFKRPEKLPLVDCSLASTKPGEEPPLPLAPNSDWPLLEPAEPLLMEDAPDLPPHARGDTATSKPTIRAEAPRTLRS